MCLLPFTTYHFEYKNGTDRAKRAVKNENLAKLKTIYENQTPLPAELWEASKLFTAQLAQFVNHIVSRNTYLFRNDGPFFKITHQSQGLIPMNNAEARGRAETAVWADVFNTVRKNDTLYKATVAKMFPIAGKLRTVKNKYSKTVCLSCGMDYITIFEPIIQEDQGMFCNMMNKEQHDALIREIQDSVSLDEKLRAEVKKTKNDETFYCNVAGHVLDLFPLEDTN